MVLFYGLLAALVFIACFVPQGLFGMLCCRYSARLHTDETGCASMD